MNLVTDLFDCWILDLDIGWRWIWWTLWGLERLSAVDIDNTPVDVRWLI